MRDSIREWIELLEQERWLKKINRKLDAVNRAIGKVRSAKHDADIQRYELDKMIDEYNMRYHDGLAVKEVERVELPGQKNAE